MRYTLHLTNRRTGAVIWSHNGRVPDGDEQLAPSSVGILSAGQVRCGLSSASTHPKRLSDASLTLIMKICESGTAREALDAARRLTAAEPEFADGWAKMAKAVHQLLFDGVPPDSAALRAEGVRAARTALRLDPKNPEAVAAHGVLTANRSIAAEERAYRRAVAARPLDCGCGWKYLADTLAGVGRWRDAAVAYQRAAEQMHFAPNTHYLRARMLYAIGANPREAEEHLALVEEYYGDIAPVHLTRLRAAIWRGDYDAALGSVNRLEALQPPEAVGRWRLALEALKGRNEAATARAVAALVAVMKDAERRTTTDAALLGALGADREALAFLAAMGEISMPRARFELLDPALKGAQSLPEFLPLAERFGLVRYWRESKTKPDVCGNADAPGFCKALI